MYLNPISICPAYPNIGSGERLQSRVFTIEQTYILSMLTSTVHTAKCKLYRKYETFAGFIDTSASRFVFLVKCVLPIPLHFSGSIPSPQTKPLTSILVI